MLRQPIQLCVLLFAIFLVACGSEEAITTPLPIPTVAHVVTEDQPSSAPTSEVSTVPGDPTPTAAAEVEENQIETPVEQTDSNGPQPINSELTAFPIIDADTNMILGGTDPAGNWLTAAAVMPVLETPITMHAYNNFNLQGVAEVSLPEQQSPICLQPAAQWQSDSDLSHTLLVATAGDGLPRLPQAIDAALYDAAIRESLQEAGISEPNIGSSSATLIDLEGDGVDEVILEASFLDSSIPSVTAGNYSMVLLRKIVNGAVVEIPLQFDTYAENAALVYPKLHSVMMIRDLNSDGIMEIIIRSERYEGRSLAVYAVSPHSAEPVMAASCEQYRRKESVNSHLNWTIEPLNCLT